VIAANQVTGLAAIIAPRSRESAASIRRPVLQDAHPAPRVREPAPADAAPARDASIPPRARRAARPAPIESRRAREHSVRGSLRGTRCPLFFLEVFVAPHRSCNFLFQGILMDTGTVKWFNDSKALA
jgi:hypothetical protein